MLKIDYCNYKIFLLKPFFSLSLCKYCVYTLVNERGFALPIMSSHDDIS